MSPLLVALLAAAGVVAVAGAVAAVLVLGKTDDEPPRAVAATAAGDTEVTTRTVVTVVESASSRSATPAPRPLELRPYSTGRYSMTVPVTWTQVSDDEDHSGVYRESRWNSPAGDAYLLVDYTVGFDGSAKSGADPLRDASRGATGYVEHAYESWLGGRFWRWEFSKGGQRKLDLFASSCGTGYAVLGVASTARFARLALTFEAAARSLSPRC